MTVETKAACYMALALIAFGAGMFKPSMQVMLKDATEMEIRAW